MISRLVSRLYNAWRCYVYRLMSDCQNVNGTFRSKQAVLITGSGTVSFGKKVLLGYAPSPYRFSSYIYIEARSPEAQISFGNNVTINNGCTFLSDNAGIRLGNNVLVGTCVEFYDSDFHELSPEKRHIAPTSQEIVIGDNVFIGSNAVILKGVIIGNNAVIASGAVVTRSIPENAVAGGNPARVIGNV